MRRLKISLLFIFVPICLFSQEIEENILEYSGYINRIKHFEKNPLSVGQTIFLGNSITEAGKWDVYFPDSNTANRGIAGDNTDGMLARIDEIIVAKPQKLFFMAGINDISLRRTNFKISRQIFEFIEKLRNENPQTEIYVQSVLPLNADKLRYNRLKSKEEQIEDLNKLLKDYCAENEITYIDLYSSMISSPRKLNPNYTADGLHLNARAYKVWVNAIKKYVEQ